MEIAALGLRVEGVTDVDRASSSLDKLTQSGDRAERSQGELATESRKSSRAIRDVGTESAKTSRNVDQVSAASNRATRGVSGLSSAARIAVGALSALGVTVGISNSIRQIADFQSAINGLAAVSGATANQMRELEAQARTLGATSMFSAQQAADGQRCLAQAGFEVNEILSATPGILQLATAGQLDLASAADIASNVLGGMRLEVDQLNRVNDVLAATAARSNTSIQQLGHALSFAAPFAASAGVEIEEAAAAIGVMSDAGIQAGRAGTGLVGVIRQLSNVTTAGESVLDKYGLSIKDVNIEALGLETVLENLRAANLNTADSIALFGSEAGAAAQVLVSDYKGGIQDATGEAERMANQLEQGLGPAFLALSSAVSESVLQLGDSGLAAALESLVNTATGVISVWNGMGDTWAEENDVGEDTLRVVEALATGINVLAVAAGARAVLAIGTLIAAKAGLTTASLTLTGVLTGLRTVFMTLFGPVGIIAGGLTILYHYREELGLVDRSAENAAAAIAASSAAIRDGNAAAMQASYENLRLELEGVSLQAQDAMAQLLKLEAAEAFSQSAGNNPALAEGFRQQISALHEELAELWETSVDVQRAMRENEEARKSLTKAESDGTSSTEILVKITRDLSETTSAAAKAIADQEKQTESLTSDLRALRTQLQPARAVQIQMAQSMNTLSLAYASGRINLQEYLDLVWLLQEAHIESADTAEDAADRIGYSFTTWEEVALNTVRRVDNAGQDLWLGFIDGSRNALDTVKRFFQQTLAEIAHMLTTQRLTVAVGGALGIGGSGAAMAGGGGMPSIGGLGSLFGGSSVGQGFMGAGNWLAGHGIGSTTGFGSQIAGTGTAYGGGGIFSGAGQYANWQYGLAGIGGGLVGNMFGGHGGIGGSLGSTIGMAAGGPIGAIAGSVIGGALGSLFGGSRSSPELNLRTVATGTMPSGGTGWEHHGNAYTSGVFGDIGFADRGTSRLSRQFPDGEHEFLEAIAAMDAMMASLAQSEEQFKAMESAARSWSARAGGPQGIVEQLSDRTATILGAIDGEFGKFVASLDGGVEEIVARAMFAQEALSMMGYLTEQLSLNFDASAYAAADSLAQLMGGIDALAASAEAYFELTYSEAERQAIALDRAYDSLQAFTDETGIIVESAAGLRQLVEGLDLTSETAQELYAQAMQLIPALGEVEQAFERAKNEAQELAQAAEDALLDSWSRFQRDSLRMQRDLLTLAGDSAGVLTLAREQELAAMDESLRPFQQRIWALQDEASAIADYQREYERAENQLASTLLQIQRFVDQQRGTLGTPQQNLSETERQWLAQLELAQSGDRAALQSITQYADRFMRSGEEYFASGEGAQRIQEQVLSALEDLPNNLTAEEFLANEIKGALKDLDISLVDDLINIAALALDELGALQQLHDETRSQVDQLVTIDSSVLSVRDAVHDLADLIRASMYVDRIAQLESSIDKWESDLERWDSVGSGSMKAAQRVINQQMGGNAAQGNLADFRAMLEAAGLGDNAQRAANQIRQQHWIDRRQVEIDEMRGVLSGLGVSAFAQGGVFTNSVVSDPTLFNMGLMGEAGPEAIMPLAKRGDGSLGIRAEVPPLPPLLGMGDVTELLQDLKRELVTTRDENRRLLELVGKNTGATAGAVMQGNELSARQRNEQLREQRAANRAARITKGGRVT